RWQWNGVGSRQRPSGLDLSLVPERRRHHYGRPAVCLQIPSHRAHGNEHEGQAGRQV
ncbi:hypothetical protein GGF37_002991, partial [Kickxella alabastrina]